MSVTFTDFMSHCLNLVISYYEIVIIKLYTEYRNTNTRTKLIQLVKIHLKLLQDTELTNVGLYNYQ